jgi:2',3'-cyclic-nucleotide 2'-phosphodiesterase
MKALYLGDIVGRAARNAVCQKLPMLRERLKLDFVVVNGENAAGGFGITPEICEDLFLAGADCLVTGNHAFDKREIMTLMNAEPRLLRPANYPPQTPGSGIGSYAVAGGRKAVVIQVMGRLFMDPLDDPFAAASAAVEDLRLGRDAQFVLLDVHAEATSEKMAMGHFMDGRVSAVIGTHTHVPTADLQLLPRGTAYQTDIGMCGDYNSVIGMDPAEPIQRFTRKIGSQRLEPALGEPTLCGVYIETDDRNGLPVKIAPLRHGGRLQQHWPS